MATWKEITTAEEWEQALENSGTKGVVVLKHSTRCPVSTNALQEYDAYLGKTPNTDVDYLLVKVIESRPVSNQIAETTGVTHASPQVLYVKNKETVWNTSHWAITEEHLHAVLS
ncbi:bacillithiol system redox-active protein YtxJ [Paenibacillus filicis]|uniref:Bacillithiol system redox-active protein YtxJ n=1 Tax=Paenibacillus filicis TaxID=669464 RepID=A0ABU9DI30_9BACL